jgi:hypothetical protein
VHWHLMALCTLGFSGPPGAGRAAAGLQAMLPRVPTCLGMLQDETCNIPPVLAARMWDTASLDWRTCAFIDVTKPCLLEAPLLVS